jgi:membrane protein implicated in regulation of membrane protease activity
MNNIKNILTVVALILGAIVALSLVGMVITALQYLFWLGVICIAAVVAVKLLKKTDAPQLESKSYMKELKSAERTLQEYKRQNPSKQ